MKLLTPDDLRKYHEDVDPFIRLPWPWSVGVTIYISDTPDFVTGGMRIEVEAKHLESQKYVAIIPRNHDVFMYGSQEKLKLELALGFWEHYLKSPRVEPLTDNIILGEN